MQIYLGKIELNHDFYKYIVIISIISFILYVLSGSLRKSLIASVMRRYRMSRPDPRITIDSDSFRVESGSSVATIGWDAFEGILKRKDRILLLVSPMSAYPIPFRSLPDGVKPEELTRRIEGYMAAATKKV